MNSCIKGDHMLRSSLRSRRSVLRNSAVGFGNLAFLHLLQQNCPAADPTSDPAAVNPAGPLSPKPTHFSARAKRVVFLFMKGGPSHVDTFDPKPLLDRDHGKPLPFDLPRVTFAKQGNLLRSPWRFKPHGESGLPVSELFPNVATHIDDLCILRSLHGTNPAHGGALLKLHTGSDQFVRPSLGSWLTYGLGTENENLPAFVTICPTLAHGGVNNWGAAFLPAHCQGTPIGNASLKARSVGVKHIRNQRIDLRNQRQQLDLIRAMNQDHLESVGSNAALEGRLDSFELAYRMQASMPELQDLTKETSATQRMYGIDDPVTEDFGRQCLMARRFLENGVRFVQVTHSDSEVQWDQHGNLYAGHTKNAAEVDKPIAGFLQDLKSRGLLEDTLVIWGGEFGRTPTAQGNNGRDHNPHGFTMWMAGGGVKGGYAYGATDDYGYYAAENKMHVHDLHATILHLMGLDHQRLTYRYAGRDFRLTDVAGQVADDILA
ncbi:MAG: sulfatase [Rhodopirellula sp.]|nr:sulfatase [Rhodopirellula sp.]OUX51994.1 MAG: sulfatase [Rhodopirellula sp. TMED283]